MGRGGMQVLGGWIRGSRVTSDDGVVVDGGQWGRGRMGQLEESGSVLSL